MVLWGFERVGIPLPEELTAGSARYLTGTYAEATDIGGNLSVRGFASKELQNQFETAIENHIPAKASVLLFNAGMERSCISIANAVCGWPCYPTRFESRILYIPECDALGRTPLDFNEEIKSALRETAQGMVDIARDYPDKRFVWYLVGGLENPSISPAYDLVSNGMSPEKTADYLEPIFRDVDNVTVLYDDYDNLDSYYNDFFRTDHHWKMTGAEKAYNTIASELELPQFSAGLKPIDNYVFSGSTARDGLFPMTEDVFDLDADFSYLTELDDNKAFYCKFNHDRFWDVYNSGDPAVVSMFHDYYFDGNYYSGGYMVGGDGDRDAFIISNSYSGDIRPLLGSHYRYLRSFVTFSRNNRMYTPLRDLIEESNPDDVVFVAQPAAYADDLPYWFLGLEDVPQGSGEDGRL